MNGLMRCVKLIGLGLLFLSFTGIAYGSTSSSTPNNLFISPTSVWSDIRENFELTTGSAHKRVQHQREVLKKHEKSLHTSLRVSAPCIAYVYGHIRKRGLPAELALLPMIESGCSSKAHSYVGAVGLWQLMPQTARGLGLKVSRAHDARKDMAASTQAALTYLSQLNKQFNNDWLLTLAAYNDGPGNIDKAIRHRGKSVKNVSFWELNLPEETREYVPKLLALADVIRDPQRYGFNLPSLGHCPRLTQVAAHTSHPIQVAATSAGLQTKLTHAWNPSYHHLLKASGRPECSAVPAVAERPVGAGASKSDTPVFVETANGLWRMQTHKAADKGEHWLGDLGNTRSIPD